MSFQSLQFAFLFLPVVLAGYFALRATRFASLAKLWLIAASLLFYAGGRVADVPVLLGAVVVNQFLARKLLSGGKSRSHWLTAGIVANIAFLCYFKYIAFFATTLNSLTGLAWKAPHVPFPLGVSFFTIQQIMFLVDCYEGMVEQYSVLDHLLFASFFPYVTMGPLVRWKQIVPQWNDPLLQRPNADHIAEGLFIFVIGWFKKAVLADTFFRWADAGFTYNHSLTVGAAWISALAFSFELYFDFSGYTDMAIGAARMLNFTLPQNFNAPFRAASIVDFWRRWHITLTNFITTYLYTPMVRSLKRVTFAKTMVITFTAMLIAGFWHGAAWTFVIFGALHGAGLVVNQIWRKLKLPMPVWLGWMVTFGLVIVSMVFFRSGSVAQAGDILNSMFNPHRGMFDYTPWSGIDRIDQLMGIAWMLCGVGVIFGGTSSMQLQRGFKPSWVNVGLATLLAVAALIYSNGIVSRSFVYRDF